MTVVRELTHAGLRQLDRLLPGQRQGKLRIDADRYWRGGDLSPSWSSNSHWADGLASDDWKRVGSDHLAIFDRFARALGLPTTPDLVIEWGCGGGANAVVFAPRATKFVAADISAESVAECVRQVASVCATPTDGVVIDLSHPELAAAELDGMCDLFICVYVIELTPTSDDALKIVDAAERLLKVGGMAILQVKYRTRDRRTRGHRRDYDKNVANMTTFWIDEFWQCAKERGLTPEFVTLVPKNHLDQRYAYYALTKPSARSQGAR